MPPESLWVQFSIVGILVLAAGFIAVAFYRLWHELLDWIKEQDKQRIAWMREQDVQREAERERQRVWQADQDKIRDLRWYDFLKNIKDEWLKQDAENTKVLRELIVKIDMLIAESRNHDTWVRAKENRE